MSVFIDTSALFSAIHAGDEQHDEALDAWTALLSGEEALITSNYVLVESSALIARRLGFEAVRAFEADFVPVLEVLWVDALLHQRSVAAMLTAGKRDLSLVDCISFELMRIHGLDAVFAFDSHFSQQGFTCIP